MSKRIAAVLLFELIAALVYFGLGLHRLGTLGFTLGIAALGVVGLFGLALATRTRALGNWRREHGRCLGCGYDLRATTERCPECGALPGQ